MTPQDLDQLLDNPNFIADIYNYCDEWCERCPLTARCSRFAIENERRTRRANRQGKEPPALATASPNNDTAEFWDELQETLQTSIDLLRQMMEEDGIDPNTISSEEYAVTVEKTRRLDEQVEQHPLALASKVYMQQAEAWFAAAEGLFEEKSEALLALVRMNVGEAQVEAEAVAITDAVEVSQGYQFVIYLNLHRALAGLLEEESEKSNNRPVDENVSAKLALIAIDRSIGAWGRLLRSFPARETETLELLVALDRLRRAVEQTFPKARAVVRPGFDTLSPLEE